MLKKLLKYDLENIYKVLIIFYSLSIFFALLTRIFLNIENSFVLNIIGQVCSGALISMIFSIIINNLMRLWVRFRTNFYGDESYLTHTLPIDKKTLYLSKIITAIVTLFVSIIVIFLTFFIAYGSNDFINMIKDMLLPIADAYNSTIIIILLAFFFILFLEFANILQCGFTGIILGHKKNNGKIGYSVLFGFITYIISQLFVIAIVLILALFNKDILNLIITNQMINISATKILIYMSIIMYTLVLIIGMIVNIKLFKKGINVD